MKIQFDDAKRGDMSMALSSTRHHAGPVSGMCDQMQDVNLKYNIVVRRERGSARSTFSSTLLQSGLSVNHVAAAAEVNE